MKKRISAFITAIILIIMTFSLPAYADEITWQDNTENGRIEKNSTDEKQPAEVNDWGGDDFVAKEEPAAENAGEEDSASKGMSAEPQQHLQSQQPEQPSSENAEANSRKKAASISRKATVLPCLKKSIKLQAAPTT